MQDLLHSFLSSADSASLTMYAVLKQRFKQIPTIENSKFWNGILELDTNLCDSKLHENETAQRYFVESQWQMFGRFLTTPRCFYLPVAVSRLAIDDDAFVRMMNFLVCAMWIHGMHTAQSVV